MSGSWDAMLDDEQRRSRKPMHETHDPIHDIADGALICINCACCACHRPEVAAAPCAKAKHEVGGHRG